MKSLKMRYKTAAYNRKVWRQENYVLEGPNLEPNINLCKEYGIEFDLNDSRTVIPGVGQIITFPLQVIYPAKNPIKAGDLILLRLLHCMNLGVVHCSYKGHGGDDSPPIVEKIQRLNRRGLLKELVKIDWDKFESIFWPAVEGLLDNHELMGAFIPATDADNLLDPPLEGDWII